MNAHGLMRISGIGLVWICVCPFASAQVQIVLRDSIGPDNSTTNGNLPFAAGFSIAGGSYSLIRVPLTPTESVVLSDVRLIGAQQSGTSLNFSAYDFYVRVWSSPQTFNANPQLGDIANLFFDAPTDGPNLFGVTGPIPGGVGVKPTYSFYFDVSGAGIRIQRLQTVFVAIVGVIPHVSNGRLGYVESSEIGPSDIWFGTNIPPPNGLVLDGTEWSLHDGRAAIAVRAHPDCPSDLDCDGSTGLSDLDTLISAMNGPDVPRGLLGCRSNDLDGDGDLDMADFAQFQAEFGSSCN